jgi:hypothetical protein
MRVSSFEILSRPNSNYYLLPLIAIKINKRMSQAIIKTAWLFNIGKTLSMKLINVDT